MKKILILFMLFIFVQFTFAEGGFTNHNAARVNIEFPSGTNNYMGMIGSSNIEAFNPGTLSNTDYLHLKFTEAWVYKNNTSDVTSVTYYYRVYPQGTTNKPAFISVPLQYQEENNSGGTTYQRWDNTLDVDLLQYVNQQGTWVFETYYMAEVTNNGSFPQVYVTKGGFGNNYEFTFNADASLPVELTTFTASLLENQVQLNWETATEVNNYGFEIERRNNNIPSSQSAFGVRDEKWTKVAFVNGNGNSNSPKTYSYVDGKVLSGEYQYRLKQIDFDGKYEYSDVVEINFGTPTKLELNQNYPNPFNPTTNIKFSLPKASNVTLKIFNAIGEEIANLINKNLDAGNHLINFNGANLNSGIYFYQLTTNKKSVVKKMLLVK